MVANDYVESAQVAAIKKIPTLNKLGYGIGNIAYSLPYQATATFFIFFATVILKIPPAQAGTAIAISSAWDALSDPLLGYISDNTESRRFGRRHQYLLIGGTLIAVLSYMLWSISPSTSLTYRFWLLFVLLLLLKTALTIFFVPYLALGGELSTDYDERSSIQGARAAFYLVGVIAAIVGATLIFFRSTPEFPKGQLNPAAYPRMALTFSVLAIIAMLISYFSTRRYIPALRQRSERMRARTLSAKHLYKDFADAMKNRDLLMIVLMIFIIEVGFQFGVAVGIHVNTYTYGFSGPIIGLLSLLLLGTAVVSQPFWVWFTKRFEKRTALIVGIVIGFFGYIGAPWAHVWLKLFPMDSPTLPWTLGIFYFVAGVGTGALMSVPNAMVADAADAEELRTGKRDEGLYFGTYIFAYKLGTSLSLMMSGYALSLIGFNPNLPTQSEATKFHLAMIPTYLLLATAPIAFLFIARYSITRERWKEIQAALKEKQKLRLEGI